MGLQLRTALILLIPAAVLLVIIYKVLPPWSPSAGRDKDHQAHHGLKTNGTHWFNNTVIIVSFDGFKPAYLTRDLTPNLLEISEKGLRADYMQSIFPTLTFPKYVVFCIITSGILANVVQREIKKGIETSANYDSLWNHAAIGRSKLDFGRSHMVS